GVHRHGLRLRLAQLHDRAGRAGRDTGSGSVSEVAAPPSRAVIVAGVEFGRGGPVQVIAGPCSVESLEQLYTVATAVRAAGVRLLRGGAFKPRTSPYSFQGLGARGLDMLREVADAVGMGVVSEA